VNIEAGLPHQVNEQLPAPKLFNGEDKPGHRAALSEADAGYRVEIPEQAALVDCGTPGGRSALGNGNFHGGILPAQADLEKLFLILEKKRGCVICVLSVGKKVPPTEAKNSRG
jgi:hypothetical protein